MAHFQAMIKRQIKWLEFTQLESILCQTSSLFEVAARVEKVNAMTSKLRKKFKLCSKVSFSILVQATRSGSGNQRIRKMSTMYPDLLAILDWDRRFVRTLCPRNISLRRPRCRKLWKCRTSLERLPPSEFETSGRRKGRTSEDGGEMSLSNET